MRQISLGQSKTHPPLCGEATGLVWHTLFCVHDSIHKNHSKSPSLYEVVPGRFARTQCNTPTPPGKNQTACVTLYSGDEGITNPRSSFTVAGFHLLHQDQHHSLPLRVLHRKAFGPDEAQVSDLELVCLLPSTDPI
mmetsp:Transcript_74138/g.130861  ORF Transcript_74138/g.130861 Transcript_74138/m.130861 type:complete len:136 (-) Transcript_74138:4090-4497(-)